MRLQRCHRAGCHHRPCCRQCAQEERAAPAGVISRASDAVAAPCHRTEVSTDYAAINVRRKSEQHLQVLFVLRAMRWQRHAIMPDDTTGHTAIKVHRKCQQRVQTYLSYERHGRSAMPSGRAGSTYRHVSLASAAAAAACHRTVGFQRLHCHQCAPEEPVAFAVLSLM